MVIRKIVHSEYIIDHPSKRQSIFRGCSYGGDLARLSGLARLGEMIFIPRSSGIFYFSSIKKFIMSLEKDYLIKYFLQ